MATYVTLPRAWVSDQEDPQSPLTCEVFETEKEPIKTGLITADGTPIYRMPTVHPIGFCR